MTWRPALMRCHIECIHVYTCSVMLWWQATYRGLMIVSSTIFMARFRSHRCGFFIWFLNTRVDLQFDEVAYRQQLLLFVYIIIANLSDIRRALYAFDYDVVFMFIFGLDTVTRIDVLRPACLPIKELSCNHLLQKEILLSLCSKIIMWAWRCLMVCSHYEPLYFC